MRNARVDVREFGGAADSGLLVMGSIGFLLSVAAWYATTRMPAAPSTTPDLDIDWNVFRQTAKLVGYARERHDVFWAVIGAAVAGAVTTGVTVGVLNGQQSPAAPNGTPTSHPFSPASLPFSEDVPGTTSANRRRNSPAEPPRSAVSRNTSERLLSGSESE